VRADDLAADVETQPQTPRAAFCVRSTPERLEETRALGLGDSLPAVADVDSCRAVGPRHRDGHRVLRRPVVDRVDDQIREGLGESVGVPFAGETSLGRQSNAVRILDTKLLDDLIADRAEVAGRFLERNPTPEARAREVEQLPDHPVHAIGARGHAVDDVLDALRRVATQKEQRRRDRVERIAQVVAQRSHQQLPRALPLALHRPPFGQVPGNLRRRDDPAGLVAHGRNGQGHFDERPVLAPPPCLVVLDALAAGDALDHDAIVLHPVRRHQQLDRPAHDLVRTVAEEPFGRRVPGQDAAGEVLGNDRVLARGDDRRQIPACLVGFPASGDVGRERRDADDAPVREDRVSLFVDPLEAAVGPRNPVVDLEVRAVTRGLVDGVLHRCPVFGMDAIQVRREGRAEGSRRQAVDRFEILGPAHPAGRDVPVPIAHLRRSERLVEHLLPGLRLAARPAGDVGREDEKGAEPEKDSHRERLVASRNGEREEGFDEEIGSDGRQNQSEDPGPHAPEPGRAQNRGKKKQERRTRSEPRVNEKADQGRGQDEGDDAGGARSGMSEDSPRPRRGRR